MEKLTPKVGQSILLLGALEKPFVASMLAVVWRIAAAVRSFTRKDVSPRSFEPGLFTKTVKGVWFGGEFVAECGNRRFSDEFSPSAHNDPLPKFDSRSDGPRY